MQVSGRVAIVTGAGRGIGAALVWALAAGGARVVAADIDESAAKEVTERVNAEHPGTVAGAGADVTDSARIAELIALAEREFGPVDMYFANAGIIGALGLDADDAEWDRALGVNVQAHVRAARLLVPGWVERGEGYFISTASAAGLLTQIGSATYSVTKHAAVGFAEWLHITYGDKGVRVSCLCPMGVNTELLNQGDPEAAAAHPVARAVTAAGEVLEPDAVAEVTLAAVAEEHFLILPHPQVLDMYRQKGSDYDRWLRGMRRYQASLGLGG